MQFLTLLQGDLISIEEQKVAMLTLIVKCSIIFQSFYPGAGFGSFLLIAWSYFLGHL